VSTNAWSVIDTLHWRCSSAHCDAEENALWAAVVALEEVTVLVDSVTPHLEASLAERLKQQAEEKRQLAREVRSVLERLQPFQTR